MPKIDCAFSYYDEIHKVGDYSYLMCQVTGEKCVSQYLCDKKDKFVVTNNVKLYCNQFKEII